MGRPGAWAALGRVLGRVLSWPGSWVRDLVGLVNWLVVVRVYILCRVIGSGAVDAWCCACMSWVLSWDARLSLLKVAHSLTDSGNRYGCEGLAIHGF